MNDDEKKALITICTLAASADGAPSEAELRHIEQLGTELGLSFPPGMGNPSGTLRPSLLREAISSLSSVESRQEAFRIATAVCRSDGSLDSAEREFLAHLRTGMGLEAPSVLAVERTIPPMPDSIAAPPVMVPMGISYVSPSTLGPTAADEEIDKMIMNHAIANAALELLPDTLATMAIVPNQMRMVYQIGKRFGFDLDKGHVKELAAAAGLGLASQWVEGYARKLVSGLLGTIGGKWVGRAGDQAGSSGMSFVSTYALGQVAKRYYAGGRTLSTDQLRQLFTSLADEARGMYGRYAGEIQQRAGKPSGIFRF